MLARNVTRGTILASRLRVARSFWGRFRGLMLTPALPRGEGLLIERCSSIHTHFMRFPIDAVFLDRDGTVLAIEAEMRPWRIGKLHRGARAVIELPAGAAAAAGTRLGDRVRVERDAAEAV